MSVPQNVFYQGRIIGKIDYYSSVWRNHSIRDVLKFLQLEDIFDFLLQDYALISSALAVNTVKFDWNGINLQVPLADIVAMQKTVDQAVSCDEFKDHKFTTIRLSLSGKPLDYLRSKWFDQHGEKFSFDRYLRLMPMELDLDFHVTRVDFAFDFINYGKDFFAKAFPFLADFRNLTLSGRLATSGMGAGMSFKPINTPAEKTLYIGSTGADRYLRIYDKYLEVKARNKGEFCESPYGIAPMEIDSWIRVEWQMRAKNAARYLYALPKDGCNYWESLLQEIVDFYEFRSCRNQGNVVPKFWRQFFDMERIGGLRQTFDFVQLTKLITEAEKNDNYVENIASTSALLYIFRHRETGYIQRLRDEWYDMIRPKADFRLEEIRQAKLRSFRARLNATVPPGLTVEEAYPWAFDEKGNLKYPRSDFA